MATIAAAMGGHVRVGLEDNLYLSKGVLAQSNAEQVRLIRSIVDERYKFSRYFSFKEFNTPKTLEELKAKNDLELYDLQADPQELNNLAYAFEKNKDLIWSMNLKLNALIEREIGKDDGSFLPFSDWINWNGARKQMMNV